MSGPQYVVDIVMCIDKTGSMAPVLDAVKNNALRFEADLKAKMAEKQKLVDQLRVRVIAFGDVYADGAAWIRESAFFELSREADRFREFVSAVRAEGGGDEPENGLEALAMAIRSNWTSAGFKRRHVIVIWTDASAHPLEKAADADAVRGVYPADAPGSFDALTDLWNGETISQSARRLVLFCPEAYPWSDISTHWEETLHFPSQAGNGLGELEYGSILDNLANSI